MTSSLTGAFVLLGALAATVAGVAPAGTPEPFRVRFVTMNGTSGPAYYSAASHAYRFLSTARPDDVAALAPSAERPVSGSARAR